MSELHDLYITFIKELNEEITDDILSQSSIIQVRRSEAPLRNGYRPILTWLYNHETVLEILEQRAKDSNEDLDRREAELFLYETTRHNYEQMSVSDCLAELYQMNRAI